MLLTIICISVICFAVIIHYEVLHQLSVILPSLKIKHRMRIVVGVIGTLFAHVIEICIFGYAYYRMNEHQHLGSLVGNFDGSYFDSIYFSFTTYTTLGFGDVEPLGPLRLLVGLEALTGLVLITWSASFLYIEMRAYWDDNN